MFYTIMYENSLEDTAVKSKCKCAKTPMEKPRLPRSPRSTSAVRIGPLECLQVPNVLDLAEDSSFIPLPMM